MLLNIYPRINSGNPRTGVVLKIIKLKTAFKLLFVIFYDMTFLTDTTAEIPLGNLKLPHRLQDRVLQFHLP